MFNANLTWFICKHSKYNLLTVFHRPWRCPSTGVSSPLQHQHLVRHRRAACLLTHLLFKTFAVTNFSAFLNSTVTQRTRWRMCTWPSCVTAVDESQNITMLRGWYRRTKKAADDHISDRFWRELADLGTFLGTLRSSASWQLPRSKGYSLHPTVLFPLRGNHRNVLNLSLEGDQIWTTVFSLFFLWAVTGHICA